MCAARVSPEQRLRMLEFMLAHADFARGLVTGPDAARTKKVLKQELSVVLNSLGSGAKKQPEKWWKCWLDWKSDTKAKWIKVKKFRGGTGRGPAPAPLSQTDTTILELCGIEMVEGVAVPDPLEESAPPLVTVASSNPAEDVVGDTEIDTPLVTVASSNPAEDVVGDTEIDTPLVTVASSNPAEDVVGDTEIDNECIPTHYEQHKKRDDPLRGSMEERQAAAMERQAAAMERQAATMESFAAGLNRLADNMAALLAIAARETH